MSDSLDGLKSTSPSLPRKGGSAPEPPDSESEYDLNLREEVAGDLRLVSGPRGPSLDEIRSVLKDGNELKTLPTTTMATSNDAQMEHPECAIEHGPACTDACMAYAHAHH